MKRISKRMLSSLLALIMVFSVMAMPALGAEEEVTQTVVRPTPIAYEWDFDDSSIKTTASNYSDGKITAIPYGNPKYKEFITGGSYDDYIVAGNTTNNLGSLEFVDDGNSGKMLRVGNPTTQAFVYAGIKFPTPLQGVVDVQFDARVGILQSDGSLRALAKNSTGTIFTTNTVTTDLRVYLGVESFTNAFVNKSFNSQVACIVDGCTNTGKTVVSDVKNLDMHTFKIRYDYSDPAAPFAIVYGEDGLPLTHGDHIARYAVNGTGLSILHFLTYLKDTTLVNGENYVMDIDNIKVTPVPAAPTASIADKTYGVDVYKNDFAVNFNATVAEADKDAVKIFDANGNEVATTNTVEGTKVNVAPKTALAPQSAYKLVIPKTEVMGTIYEAQEIGFYTAKDYALGKLTFDTELSTDTAVRNYIYSNMSGLVKDYNITAKTANGESLVLSATTTKTGTASAAQKEDYVWLITEEPADEIYHAEFFMDLATSKSYWKPFILYNSQTQEIARFRTNATALQFYVGATEPTGWAGPTYKLHDISEGQKGYKYIVDINLKTGTGTCQVINPDTGALVKTVTHTATDRTKMTEGTKTKLSALVNGSVYTDTVTEGDTTTYTNTVYFDDILIADMPIPEAKFATPTVGVEAGDTPEIEFNYPVVDASKLELYVGENKVEDAVFTLSPDGYTVTVDAAFAEDTEYSVKLDAVTTMGGGALSGSIGFLTAPKAPQFTIDANVYAKADTEFATPLAGLTADEEVAVVVDVTNNENTVAFDTIVYVGVYTEGGNLLIATATEENFKPGTAELTSSFKVPANAHHIKVFAWDKYLTPYCVPTELFNN